MVQSKNNMKINVVHYRQTHVETTNVDLEFRTNICVFYRQNICNVLKDDSQMFGFML